MTPPGNQPITMSSKVVADPRQVSADVEGETLILHLDTGNYHSLRKVAAEIWKLLTSPILVSDIVETLALRYGVPQARGEADLLELLGELEKRGLVRVVGPVASPRS